MADFKKIFNQLTEFHNQRTILLENEIKSTISLVKHINNSIAEIPDKEIEPTLDNIKSLVLILDFLEENLLSYNKVTDLDNKMLFFACSEKGGDKLVLDNKTSAISKSLSNNLSNLWNIDKEIYQEFLSLSRKIVEENSISKKIDYLIHSYINLTLEGFYFDFRHTVDHCSDSEFGFLGDHFFEIILYNHEPSKNKTELEMKKHIKGLVHKNLLTHPHYQRFLNKKEFKRALNE